MQQLGWPVWPQQRSSWTPRRFFPTPLLDLMKIRWRVALRHAPRLCVAHPQLVQASAARRLCSGGGHSKGQGCAGSTHGAIACMDVIAGSRMELHSSRRPRTSGRPISARASSDPALARLRYVRGPALFSCVGWTRPTLTRNPHNLAKIRRGRNSVDFDKGWPGASQSWPGIAQLWPNFGQPWPDHTHSNTWPGLGQIWPGLGPNLAPIRPDLAGIRSSATQHGRESSKLGPKSVDSIPMATPTCRPLVGAPSRTLLETSADFVVILMVEVDLHARGATDSDFRGPGEKGLRRGPGTTSACRSEFDPRSVALGDGHFRRDVDQGWARLAGSSGAPFADGGRLWFNPQRFRLG